MFWILSARAASVWRSMEIGLYFSVRRDCHAALLERTCEGSFKITHPDPKVFTIDREEKVESYQLIDWNQPIYT